SRGGASMVCSVSEQEPPLVLRDEAWVASVNASCDKRGATRHAESRPVQPRHIAPALLLALCWGLNFVVIKVALGDVPPLLLAALRFGLAALPCLVLPRPALSWRVLVAVAATIYVGQFGLLFPAMAVGMPPGLASIGLQVQAF